VREQPGSPLERMCVLLRHPPYTGPADVGDHRLCAHELRQLLEICVAVGGSETADYMWGSVLVPAYAPTVRMLATLHPKCVCAVEQLVGYAVPVPGLAAEEAAHFGGSVIQTAIVLYFCSPPYVAV